MPFRDIEISDIVLFFSVLIFIGLTILYKWTISEFILVALSIGISNYAGAMKQNKRKSRGE